MVPNILYWGDDTGDDVWRIITPEGTIQDTSYPDGTTTTIEPGTQAPQVPPPSSQKAAQNVTTGGTRNPSSQLDPIPGRRHVLLPGLRTG
ncbi:hypothetical protein [uncultured Corynebacterium sp.]|uniref:hypothetical protein n=1 Tax=uncultured Corynebacterium sp. TaxID=159447 RepID=UPI002623713D|nr:hypothetical protein [uncultured Corynebacterium sp.]